MTSLTLLVVICLAAMPVLVGGQAVYVWLYARMLRTPARLPEHAGAYRGEWQPKTAILLCVRGRDPSLQQCLAALDRQDWPDYGIWIGLDSASDSAMPLVQAFRASAVHPVTVHVLQQIGGQCSLKCEVLAEMVGAIGVDSEAVALVDADVIVASDWLGRMIRPLEDGQVGAVTGTRWLEPATGTDFRWGTYVRAIWNTAAIVQMHLYQIVWGGSLALRTQTVRDLNLAGEWRKRLCEDTCLNGLLRSRGLRVVRPADLVVSSDESCSLRAVRSWITRQLMTVRMHDRHWPWVALHGLILGNVTGLALVAGVANAVAGNWLNCLVLFLAFQLYSAASWLLLERVTRLVAPWIKPGQNYTPSVRREWIVWMCAVPLAQITHFAATLAALTARTVTWRKIRYRCAGERVRLENYIPFEQHDAGDASLN